MGFVVIVRGPSIDVVPARAAEKSITAVISTYEVSPAPRSDAIVARETDNDVAPAGSHEPVVFVGSDDGRGMTQTLGRAGTCRMRQRSPD